MARRERLEKSVELPPGLTVEDIRRSVLYIEKELPDLIDVYVEQANVFSAIVGIYGTKALDATSVYEKNRNIDLAQQRFPDLRKRGSGRVLRPEHSLESKGSKRPWSVQSHFDHPGWYIIWRYLVDPTATIEPDRPVIMWRVDVAFLAKEDWKYEGSKASAAGGGRTHTFGLKSPRDKLRGKHPYWREDIRLKGGKPVATDIAEG